MPKTYLKNKRIKSHLKLLESLRNIEKVKKIADVGSGLEPHSTCNNLAIRPNIFCFYIDLNESYSVGRENPATTDK